MWGVLAWFRVPVHIRMGEMADIGGEPRTYVQAMLVAPAVRQVGQVWLLVRSGRVPTESLGIALVDSAELAAEDVGQVCRLVIAFWNSMSLPDWNRLPHP
ncbi:hypothetical protein EFBL_1149 [Effusibacillus lacus]|uniref:Uncharacterized protein n=1 Tax=Effusibacillus lacus TaxID=1348429 RepID=A0A292YLZ5_9BACL|nr:hypothetical protein EFBL_1149 [Effusibacillus lacus]